ncbi:GNAT family N-acetyltransferase [Rhodococcus antarcticus]|uniref:GNAT family N-acetyltransferase n=1 Tax=Rhodococcus antarcticus TaxID=2987751 RepID=A0ABY6P4B7_9NOCA|nr:GNAT family N-acetyltransferase [Rhodococcus antarcticus]UZJ26519.1 GNAT family N-acetyltransferase [Rhodococcus antarcticus]
MLYKLLELRVEVFVVEQKCAYPELDGKDLLSDTRHVWIEQDGQVLCTARLLEEHDGGERFRLGRLCTAAASRGQGHTKRVLQAALAEVGSMPCVLDAQAYLVDMYAQYGFVPDGEERVEDGIAHVPLRRG